MLPPLQGIRYRAFVDPSGGSSDSFTTAISHRETRSGSSKVILDALVERIPPFSPDDVIAHFARILKDYRITSVLADRYAGEFPVEGFKKQGIHYEPSAKPKSDLYRDMLPMLNSGTVHLLDIPRAITQIASLERRTARSGKDSIDHPPGGAHDALANAIAGAVTMVGASSYTLDHVA